MKSFPLSMGTVRRLRGPFALFTFSSLSVASGASQVPTRRFCVNRIYFRHYSHDKRFHSPRQSDTNAAPLFQRVNVEFVTPLDIDARAATHLTQRLKRAHNNSSDALSALCVINIPKSTMKRALLRFDVGGRTLVAIGQSTRAKQARALCCMHALRLLDYYSTENNKDSSDREPLPLEETPVVRSSAAQRRLPVPRDKGDWSAYIKSCEVYICHAAQAAREKAFAEHRIPPSGHPLIDRAAALVERSIHNDKNNDNDRHNRSDSESDRFALQQLRRELGAHSAAAVDIRVSRVGARAFAATCALSAAPSPSSLSSPLSLSLPSPFPLTAIGVAATAKSAKRRCALHARAVLRLAHRCAAGRSPRGSLSFSFASASLDAMAESLPPRRARQLRFFARLGGPAPVADFSNISNVSDISNISNLSGRRVRCRLSLGGAAVCAEGATKFEAERRAVDDALAALELHDERLQAINSAMAKFPAIRPQHMPSAKLPKDIREAVRGAVARSAEEREKKGEKGESEGAAAAAAVDRETMTAIAAMESAANANPSYAAQMRERLAALRADSRYLAHFHARRESLAIAQVQQRILDALDAHRVVVVSGTTGCGKTTQVPQFILDHEIMAGRGDRCCIVLTQPRRLSAMSIAERIASERLSAVGEEIGYAVRLDARPGRHVTLCTTGVLLQMLASMPTLSAVTHLIIDEVHERDINCDVVLALARQLLSGPNKHLKVILMSATMQSDTFAAYFGGVPVISVDGAVYPVEVRYLDDIAKRMQARGQYSFMFDALEAKPSASSRRSHRRYDLTRAPKTDYALLAHLVEHSVAEDMRGGAAGKSVLVFLPGWKEMQAARRALESISGAQRYHIILLHSTVDAAKQRECFAPAPAGRVKIILATNIAESGITIDDAVVVIDTGLIKQTAWVFGGNNREPIGTFSESHIAHATQLALTFASRANCTQRKGRAGRTQGGVCYRLFTREVWDALPAFQRAEIHRTPLSQIILKLLSLGHAHPRETLQTFMEPPAERNVEVSIRQLQSLGAVTTDEKLTSLGIYLSRLPCEPHVGKMLMMGAVLQCLDSALTMVATGSISPFITSRDVSFEVRERRYALAMGSESDHIGAINAYNAFSARRGDEAFARENYLHYSNMRLISRYKQQYCDILRRSGFLRAGETLRRVESNSGAPNDKPSGAARDNNNNNDDDDDDVLCMDTTNTQNNNLYVDAGPLSRDATDVALVKACLCSALFPNVAVADQESMLQAKPTKRLVMRTAAHPSISPSKDSSCRRIRPPGTRGAPAVSGILDEMDKPAVTPSMLYMYESVFSMKETREEFLTQVSSVSLWALLLFGATEANTTFDRELGLCIVGGWIGIQIDAESFDALKELRAALHACVLRKYTQPNDEANNKTLEELRHLCKAVLKSPPNDGEHYVNRLVDAGRILSPVVAEPLTEDSTENNDGKGDADALSSLYTVR